MSKIAQTTEPANRIAVFSGIYPWAGEYRRVNISKGGFTFAMAAQVPRLMAELEESVLAAYTPAVSGIRKGRRGALPLPTASWC